MASVLIVYLTGVILSNRTYIFDIVHNSYIAATIKAIIFLIPLLKLLNICDVTCLAVMPLQCTMPSEHLFFQLRVIATCNHKHKRVSSHWRRFNTCTCWVGTWQQIEFTLFNMSVSYGEFTIHPSSYHLWHTQSIQVLQNSFIRFLYKYFLLLLNPLQYRIVSIFFVSCYSSIICVIRYV